MSVALTFVFSCTNESSCKQELCDSDEQFEVVSFCKETLNARLARGGKAILVLPTPESYCWGRFVEHSEELDVSADLWLIRFDSVCDLKREYARQVECIWLEDFKRIFGEHGGKSTLLEAMYEERARSANDVAQANIIDQIAWCLIGDQLMNVRRYRESCTAKALYFKPYGANSLGSSIAEFLRGLAQIADERTHYSAGKFAAAEAEKRLRQAVENEFQLKEETANCVEELSETRNELVQLKKMLATETDRSRSATRDLKQAQKSAAAADEKLERIREERDRLIEAVEEIYASKSWKITAPMRAFLKGFSRHDSK